MTSRFTLVGVALGVLAPSFALAQRPEPPIAVVGMPAEAASSITADDIRRRIATIAHDSMLGRDTPSAGLEAVAAYIGGEFGAFGLRPGGESGSYLQRYPIQRVQLDLSASTVAVAGGPTWHVGTDVVRHIGLTPAGGVSGPAVVIGGTPAGAEAMSELPLTGAMVLVVTPLNQATNRLVAGALRQGAAGVVLVTPRPAPRWNRLLRAQDRERWVKGWDAEGDGLPVVEIRDSIIAPILRAHGFDLSGAAARAGDPAIATPLPALRLVVTLRDRVLSQFTPPNVVGILEGSDPTLRNEYIVFSAHMDHVGVGRPVRGDSIYNGADDDASGTVGVIELAEAFSQLDPRPRRSLIFLTVSGEEKGLWGSEYFAARPPVPIDRIVADFNIDMIGRNWRDTIVVIGKEHSDLGTTLGRVNAAHRELRMTAVDDLWPEENFYRRSDHFNFARKGVPILFFFNGTHEDYHRPGDEVEKIDAEKESRIVKLLFFLGLEVANARERPKWNPESYAEIVERGGS